MSQTKETKLQSNTRRKLLKAGAAGSAALFAPYIRTAKAAPTEINILSWYGLGEPDMVAEFEEANNVKFNPKYYAGGDNMLAALAQSPPDAFDLIHTCLLYTSPSPRDQRGSRMPSSA